MSGMPPERIALRSYAGGPMVQVKKRLWSDRKVAGLPSLADAKG